MIISVAVDYDCYTGALAATLANIAFISGFKKYKNS